MSQGPRVCLDCHTIADLKDALELRDSWGCPVCKDRWRLGRLMDLLETQRQEYANNTRLVKFIKGQQL